VAVAETPPNPTRARSHTHILLLDFIVSSP